MMDEPKAVMILFTNGMVACLDEQGEQMPEYQGQYGDVINKILDRWPHRAMVLAQHREDGSSEILAWFLPKRIEGG